MKHSVNLEKEKTWYIFPFGVNCDLHTLSRTQPTNTDVCPPTVRQTDREMQNWCLATNTHRKSTHPAIHSCSLVYSWPLQLWSSLSHHSSDSCILVLFYVLCRNCCFFFCSSNVALIQKYWLIAWMWQITLMPRENIYAWHFWLIDLMVDCPVVHWKDSVYFFCMASCLEGCTAVTHI